MVTYERILGMAIFIGGQWVLGQSLKQNGSYRFGGQRLVLSTESGCPACEP